LEFAVKHIHTELYSFLFSSFFFSFCADRQANRRTHTKDIKHSIRSVLLALRYM